ncbi:MAG: carbamate kinase [Mycoplasma sp.]|nr:carbamate kinase [Mycoplasma sp.]
MSKKIVVALGGNALGKNPQEQKEIVKETAKSLVYLIEQNHKLIIVHGNGPQVGMINLAFAEGSKANNAISNMPFPECGSMSQGYIGYHLQQAINNELKLKNINKSVTTIVTQVEVDKNDLAFSNPTKPIGSFYTAEEAKLMMQKNDITMKEDAGRGWRKVIASPLPINIVEKEIINDLVSNNHVLITCGGGGIPVIKKDGLYTGIDAVIDKDFAASLLAKEINADSLIILTAVDQVILNYNTPAAKNISQMTIDEAREYIKQNHFAPGSMLPKVEAAIKFVDQDKSKTAIIANLNKIKDVLEDQSGTKIIK